MRTRIAVSALTLALVSLCASRPAHAVFGAVGWLGYGYIVQDPDNEALGPTLELGGSFSVPIAAVDLTYWNDLDEAGDSSQIRLGARLTPPIIPFYGRLALGFAVDGGTRDLLGTDVVFGAGLSVLSLPLIKLNVELDYHYWTDASDIHPLEAKAGIVIGF
ncbi:MAG TPA: hypothetical protein VEL05_09545 [Candidatus Acidoferrum sp.]|nr:hypothetical protein [Candidatus Acidoferrum sp.]